MTGKTIKSAMVSHSQGASNDSQSPSAPKGYATQAMTTRLTVGLLMLNTMGLMCQLSQILITSSSKIISAFASSLILFVAFFGHVWTGIHSNALTRAKKAYFDESNVLETYQPRARTMGHLFCPEPPTPAPTVKITEADDPEKHTEAENAQFNAMRDSHYANMFEYAMKMQKEMDAMEKANKSPVSGPENTQSSSTATAPSSTSTKKSANTSPPTKKR